MKKSVLFLLFSIIFLISCKKDTVDATNLKTFQSSINDMASSLTTMENIKFNEALYILKTFAVNADGDINELNGLAQLLNGKKTEEILALADAVAQKNGISWSSTGPPTLGNTNIFGTEEAQSYDPSDVDAEGVSLVTKVISGDSITGPKVIQVKPVLLDNMGKVLTFKDAALETTMQVTSSGRGLLTAKNLMVDNNFSGFMLKLANIPAEKVVDNKIDITIFVKTAKKTLKMSKIGIEVNPMMLRQPTVVEPALDENGEEESGNTTTGDESNGNGGGIAAATTTPKATVQRFLNNVNTQNLKAAYDDSQNPSWGSYEVFSNATSGFGSVKNLTVKNISPVSGDDSNAEVSATYDVTDRNGNKTTVKANFGLKNVNGTWKISNYKINP